MATIPKAIELTPEQRQQLAELADRPECSWEEALSEALSAYRPRNGGKLNNGKSWWLGR